MRLAFTRVWSYPEYRSLLLLMVLSGISISAFVPLVSLFLVQTLDVDDVALGLFTLTFLASPVVGVAVGRFSDRLRSRLPLIVAVVVWTAGGRVAMAAAPTFGIAIAVALVFGAFAGVSQAQAFALLKDVIEREQERSEATVASTVRTGYSLGWAAGPLLGGALAAALGYRAALAATAVLVLITLVPLRGLRGVRSHPTLDDRSERGPDGRPAPKRTVRGGMLLWLFAAACLLALTGEAIRLTYLPVLAVDRLAVPLALFGVLVAVAPLAEVVVMPLAGATADRWGLRIVILVGFALGAVGFLVFAYSAGALGLLVGQLLNACFIAVVLGLGVTYAQRLQPAGAGFAASVFFAAQSLSAATGGVIGSGAVAILGLPRMFLVPAILCLGACCLLLLIRPTQRIEVGR